MNLRDLPTGSETTCWGNFQRPQIVLNRFCGRKYLTKSSAVSLTSFFVQTAKPTAVLSSSGGMCIISVIRTILIQNHSQSSKTNDRIQLHAFVVHNLGDIQWSLNVALEVHLDFLDPREVKHGSSAHLGFLALGALSLRSVARRAYGYGGGGYRLSAEEQAERTEQMLASKMCRTGLPCNDGSCNEGWFWVKNMFWFVSSQFWHTVSNILNYVVSGFLFRDMLSLRTGLEERRSFCVSMGFGRQDWGNDTVSSGQSGWKEHTLDGKMMKRAWGAWKTSTLLAPPEVKPPAKLSA